MNRNQISALKLLEYILGTLKLAYDFFHNDCIL